MKHVFQKLAVGVLLLSSGSVCAWSATDAVVSGVVRDTHGIPQLGAMVELLSSDASVIARAFTDDHGRYSLAAALPGSYQLRASAAFLIPTVRGDLRLRSGARAVADLTMTAIFEAGVWLPTESRRPAEPADDWRWTLRSTANRPMLRLVDDASDTTATDVSSSEIHPRRVVSEGLLSVMAGDGSFGEGGTHQMLRLDRSGLDGEASVLKANLGDSVAPGVGASVTLAAGLERKRTFGGDTRMLVSFASHPELQTGAGAGLQVLHIATSEQVALGDMVAVDAGTLFTAERLVGERFNSAPYVRVAFRPTPELTVEYRFATDRNLQRSQDVDQTAVPEQDLSDPEGHPLLQRAMHQELAVTRDVETNLITVAVYRDAIPVEGVPGGGEASPQNFAALPILADPTTRTFRVAIPGIAADGARMSWTQVFSPAISATVEADYGSALQACREPLTTTELASSVHPHAAASLSAAMDVSTKRTGTMMNVRYRWQPHRSLTQVDEFDAMPGDAFLGLRFKQRLWAGRRLKGVNAVVDATNLLAQGYEPLLGPDGETLFLAQVPRGLQGGLAFSF